MKAIISAFLLLSFGAHAKTDSLEAFEREYQRKQEQLQQKWDMKEEECKKKFPSYTKRKHPHFQSFYNCIEVIDEEAYEFEESYEDELCRRFKAYCDEDED